MKSIEFTNSGSINSISTISNPVEQQRIEILSLRKGCKGAFSINTHKIY